MKRIAAKIDRCSTERANHHNREMVSYTLKRADIYTNDPQRETRLAASECLVCYGVSRIGGASCTIAPCPLCGTRLSCGNTAIDVLCTACAKANDLCKHCGADVELKNRRKPRPYESWPKPKECECGALVGKMAHCYDCGASQPKE